MDDFYAREIIDYSVDADGELLDEINHRFEIIDAATGEVVDNVKSKAAIPGAIKKQRIKKEHIKESLGL